MSRPSVVLLILVVTQSAIAATYYMSPTGNDADSGTSVSQAWASPNHALNCGDVINASVGSYSQLTAFGSVTCSGGNNVAWLKCAIFDHCKISVASGGPYAAGIQVGQSYWGVQGWEVTIYSGGGSCFFAFPATSTDTIHHILFANDLCSGAGQSGFQMAPNGAAGVDYFAAVGDIAYNTVQGSNNCTSGFNAFRPIAADSLLGTHIYFAGNFAFGNVEPAVCAGTQATDGQGLFFDSTQPYAQQMVMDNNIAVFNGGSGLKSYANSNGNPNAAIYIRHNTTFGNERGGVNGAVCAEIAIQASLSTQVYENLAETGTSALCAGTAPEFVTGSASTDATDQIFANYGFSAKGNNTTGAPISFGPNNIFADHLFANPKQPFTPSCGDSPTVPKCMSKLIAGFTATAPNALSYGYQIPNGGQIFDPLFPQWLCNVNLPFGLVTMGCLTD